MSNTIQKKGASPFDDVNSAKLEVLISLISERTKYLPLNILVVGCGTGREAGIFARRFNADTIGIDIEKAFAFDHVGSAPAKLMNMDAQSLDFVDEQFDIVFSFHALEHIPNPKIALKEMSRVLRPGGIFCIGTPNKSRLIGYVNLGKTMGGIIRSNWNDWRMRLAGKWDNALGAHAGFTANELLNLCQEAFGEAQEISGEYYKSLYPRPIVRKLVVSQFRHSIYPCVYVIGHRT